MRFFRAKYGAGILTGLMAAAVVVPGLGGISGVLADAPGAAGAGTVKADGPTEGGRAGSSVG